LDLQPIASVTSIVNAQQLLNSIQDNRTETAPVKEQRRISAKNYERAFYLFLLGWIEDLSAQGFDIPADIVHGQAGKAGLANPAVRQLGRLAALDAVTRLIPGGLLLTERLLYQGRQIAVFALGFEEIAEFH
jgi:hypothetical protein